ncbi:phage Gp37/Gp68 family protein [Streptomyces sp. 4N509B]|uniref:phage Gp37/Gp68 family protein n=1 Tax=Streptomyces sp. 4N509B TaxID=3457413 RepID=UPI003FD1B265
MSTTIEWTNETWNPTTGCDRISPGCDNCYALTMARRLKAMGQTKYQTDGNPVTSGPGFGLATHRDALTEPLRWKKPRKVFVNSMSDLFHARVPRAFLAQVFAVMAATPQHTYQILTKRPERAARILTDRCTCGTGHPNGEHFRSEMEWAATSHSPTYVPGLEHGIYHRSGWPLPNVWIGTSVEDQKRADLRVPALLDTPAAVRFLSCEPLLGPVDLKRAVSTRGSERGHGLTASFVHTGDCCRKFHGIDWVIVGGESGHGARPMDIKWAESLVHQCQVADVPVFVKQLGIRAGGKQHHDIDSFPEALRVREFPGAVTVR